MLSNMVKSLMEHGRVITTVSRARALKPLADKMIGLARTGTVHARRQAYQTIRDRAVLKKLFDRIGPEFSDREGGYTRAVRVGFRKGDNAALSIVELVNYKPAAKEEEQKGKKKRKSPWSRKESKKKKDSGKDDSES
jgi:large subunit ribosomal protein L17